MSDEILTRRERIMREICRRLDEMQEGQPVEDPFRTTFEFISRGASLEGAHETVRYAAAVLDTEEQKDPKINQYNAMLRVVVEFHCWVDEGDEPSTAMNRVLGDVQRKMREDVHLTEPDDGRPLIERELSYDLEETGNQGFIDGFADRQVQGAVFFNVKYKHAIDDPREYVGQRNA
jgi:hypothetical protein